MEENVGEIFSLTEKGYGFISIEGRKQKLFFHAKDLADGVVFDELAIGDRVMFGSIAKTEKGESAQDVDLVR